MIAGICIGQIPIQPDTVLSLILSHFFDVPILFTDEEYTIVMNIRLPRVILAAAVGCSLSISGAAFQSLFRNPMADPFILGVSNGAALGATSVIIAGVSLGLGVYDLPILAAVGAILTVFLVYLVAKSGHKIPVTTLLLSGVAISAFLSSITSFIMFSGHVSLNGIMFWLMGGFAGRGFDYVLMVVPFSIIGLIVLMTLSRELNALMFGDESANYLGINVEKLKKILLVTAAIITGTSVAASGVIGFVGLIVPHIVRLCTGPDHRILLPVTAIVGAIFLICADLIARMVLAPSELPLGVITAMFGAPFFLYLLKSRKGEI